MSSRNHHTNARRREQEMEKRQEELAHLLEQFRTTDSDEIAAKLMQVIIDVAEDTVNYMDLPDPDEILTPENLRDHLREADVVEKGDLEDLVTEEDMDGELEEYLKNDDVEDAFKTVLKEQLSQLEQVTSLRARGFFGRLKWLLLGK
jgi:hypothetical protein